MKKYIFIFAAVALIVGLAFTSFSNGKTKVIKSGILSVNDIKGDPFAYKGTITITGVVARTHPKDPKIFAIIETAEAISCKITGCASFYLPVSYEGQIPKEWDEVNVTGSFFEGKPVFLATKVEVLKHITFGGK